MRHELKKELVVAVQEQHRVIARCAPGPQPLGDPRGELGKQSRGHVSCACPAGVAKQGRLCSCALALARSRTQTRDVIAPSERTNTAAVISGLPDEPAVVLEDTGKGREQRADGSELSSRS